jgi:aryl-alcohol dehydrogenase-like predicted oxidoreductase
MFRYLCAAVPATKVGNKMSGRPNESRYSRAWAQRECEASLQRLKTDCIDVYYLQRDYNGMDLEVPVTSRRNPATRSRHIPASRRGAEERLEALF